MSKFIDLTGKTFGRWTVISKDDTPSSQTKWICKCECGKIKSVSGASLRFGSSHSCGCLTRESTIKRSTIHGHANRGKKTPTYSSWVAMMNRCNIPSNKHYSDYGGRGITVCERWKHYENFLADMGEKPELKSLDRIDNEKGYTPDNCRWADSVQQSNNRRNCLFINYNGERITLSMLSRKTGIGRFTLRNRIFNWGWSVDLAATTPTRKGSKFKTTC